MRTLEADILTDLLAALKARGYVLIGPTVQDGAITYDEIDSAGDLPIGWTDEQAAGHYRLRRRDDAAFFGYVVGPHSWKWIFYPPVRRLWTVTRGDDSLHLRLDDMVPRKLALIGVRACDLCAIQIQDRVLAQGDFTDAFYRAQRENVFIVAVNCVEPGGTCFCASLNSGPRVEGGFDVALTEVLQDSRHLFLAAAGSDQGREILAELPGRTASDEEHQKTKKLLAEAAAHMGRNLATEGLQEILYRNAENPHWQETGRKCLACANCTMVCPTCFCHTVEDVTDLTGQQAERIRRWDSCFTADFSYIHGGSVRPSTYARYRQWLTHKLATWHDQFGTSGCVGCGRCITWCPVGIDLTAEAAAIRETDPGQSTLKESAS